MFLLLLISSERGLIVRWWLINFHWNSRMLDIVKTMVDGWKPIGSISHLDLSSHVNNWWNYLSFHPHLLIMLLTFTCVYRQTDTAIHLYTHTHTQKHMYLFIHTHTHIMCIGVSIKGEKEREIEKRGWWRERQTNRQTSRYMDRVWMNKKRQKDDQVFVWIYRRHLLIFPSWQLLLIHGC